MRGLALGLVATAIAGLLGCGGGNAAAELAKPPDYAPDQQTKCRVTKSPLKPLIIEWPAAERTALEAQRMGGVTVVRYDGCDMELLRDCSAPGGYDYLAVTPKQENVSIRDADELYATIPVYAASFEGKLARAGRLDVNMTIVGVYQSKETPTREALVGDCSKATHVVRALTVGAFEFSAGASAEVGAGVEVASAGAGARSLAKREVLSRDGDALHCAEQGTDASEPPFGCGALLRLEVARLPAAATSSPPSGPAPSSTPTTTPQRPPLIDALRE